MRSQTSKRIGKTTSVGVVTKTISYEKWFDQLMKSLGAQRMSASEFRKIQKFVKIP